MSIDTEFLRRCLCDLEDCQKKLEEIDTDEAIHSIYRAACVRQFGIILEQASKLLRKALKAYFVDRTQADRLVFKDVFRYAAKHALIEPEACERWFSYRENRNDIEEEYGEDFVWNIIRLLPDFIKDAKALATAIEGIEDD